MPGGVGGSQVNGADCKRRQHYGFVGGGIEQGRAERLDVDTDAVFDHREIFFRVDNRVAGQEATGGEHAVGIAVDMKGRVAISTPLHGAKVAGLQLLLRLW